MRRPLLVPEPTTGAGSAKVWRPWTPAMAAGVTDHVWTLQEGLRYRVPPGPQPQTVCRTVTLDERGSKRLRCAQMQTHWVGRGGENAFRVRLTG